MCSAGVCWEGWSRPHSQCQALADPLPMPRPCCRMGALLCPQVECEMLPLGLAARACCAEAQAGEASDGTRGVAELNRRCSLAHAGTRRGLSSPSCLDSWFRRAPPSQPQETTESRKNALSRR